MFRQRFKTREIIPISHNEKKYKNIRETYKIVSFLMVLSLMYPNPLRDKNRRRLICFVIVISIPAYLLIGHDAVMRYYNQDFENFVRHCIILVAMAFIQTKAIVSVIRRKELKKIFDTLDKDYEEFNNASPELQELIDDTIKKTRKLGILWTCIFLGANVSFPIGAIVMTMFSQFFGEVPRKYMLHEMNVWGLTEEQLYSSPWFELTQVYSLFINLTIFLGFTGWDGLFSVCVLHVTLKIKLFCHRLRHLLDDNDDIHTLKLKLNNIIREHSKAYTMIKEIQICYEIWMALIFTTTAVEISMSLLMTTSDSSTGRYKYFFILIAAAAHIYFPCYLTSEITSTVADIANEAYCCGWELIPDPSIRRDLAFIIARAQIVTNFKAFGVCTFDMDLFVSIIRSAYSMYTLLQT